MRERAIGIVLKHGVNQTRFAKLSTLAPRQRASLKRGSYHRFGFYRSFRHHFVSLRDTNNFFDGCSALGDAPPAILSQSLHAFGDCALHDQFPHRLRDETNFINRRTTLISSLAALITTGATSKASTEFFYRNTNLRKIVAREINHFDTVGTNGAHQPLRDKRLHHRGKQEGLHVHVE